MVKTAVENAQADADALFAGGGDLGQRMRDFAWETTPLGAVSSWPQSLKTCVRIILTSRQPMFIWWGDSLINLYNDAYKAIVGGKHPQALGQPAALVWKEIWSQVGPRAQSAMERNEGTYDEALLLIMERHGYPEETYYTFSYSPVPNDEGGAGGIICANSDDTQRIVGERQLTLLRALASDTAQARTVDEACSRAALALGGDAFDLPFALIYLADDDRVSATLASCVGIAPGHAAAPARLDLTRDGALPVAHTLATRQLSVVAAPSERLGTLPAGAWDKPATQLALLSISPAGETGRAGLLIVGLSPYRVFDEAYRGFVTIVAGQISASIANAEAYEQERKRSDALAELDRAKTAFFSNVSHEFRTPLTLMLGPLEDAVASGTHVLSGDNLDTAYRNALRLLKLVNTLLDFSRIEAGRVNACFEPTDLALFTADLASAFRSAIERAGLSFEVDVAAADQPAYVDRDMWEKIVLNLLSNALKFTFSGRIAVRLRRVEREVQLSVTDTGSGIAEAELDNVFKRFHRVQGARSRTHEGSGIGLALVSELVRLHGGSIRVASQLGVGSTFTVRLPLGPEQLPKEQVRKPVGGSTASGAAPYVQEAQRWLPVPTDDEPSVIGEAQLGAALPLQDADRGARILVADDNADMRDYVTRLLRERFQVRAVSDGAQALAAALADPPDLLLSDVMMPNLDGFGLLHALRHDPRTRAVPVLMLSARAGEEARSEGLEAGADDYLVKPFSARELLARVSTHLQIARLRKTAERERTRLNDIFTQAPAAVAVLIGPELRFEVANPAYCELVGKVDLVGRALREVFPELAQHESTLMLERVLNTGESVRIRELNISLLRRGSLRDLYFDVIAQPLQGNATHADGLVVIANEITEQVLARRRVEALRATAEEASRAKDEFLSTLSHELRTPLNAIIGWSTLLRKGNLPPERVARALETVERNAFVQARLIEDMLDLSRIERGKLVLSVGPLEMVRVVEAAIEAVRPAADAKGVRIQPVLDSHATIVGDADRLQQVVWNLLSNAIKFTPKGGRVLIGLRREHSYVEVTVADNGEGIQADFLPYVFERFRQADPSFTRRTGGLGLGLAIVRSLVELHGGTVAAQSDGAGMGATFVVQLPTAPLRADRAPPAAELEPGAARARNFDSPPVLKDLRVLVVDDEHETRELLRFVLEQCEARVVTAASAEAALEALETQSFDMLISDVGMPDMDGYALIERVRALTPERGGRMPALSLTAYARSEDRSRALRAGFNMHLAKPIDPSELLVVIATLIRDLVPSRS